MFALAIWDARRRQLLLARDRLGKKPLVYRHEPGRLLFASELKSILQVDGRAARDRPAGAGRVSHLPVRAASADDFSRHRQTAARPLRRVSRRPARRAALLAAGFQPFEEALGRAGESMRTAACDESA